MRVPWKPDLLGEASTVWRFPEHGFAFPCFVFVFCMFQSFAAFPFSFLNLFFVFLIQILPTLCPSNCLYLVQRAVLQDAGSSWVCKASAISRVSAVAVFLTLWPSVWLYQDS